MIDIHRNKECLEREMAEIGLLLASRQVDQFSLMRAPHRMLRLSVVKERTYLPADGYPAVCSI